MPSIEDVTLDPAELDFTDLEEKYRVDLDYGIEEYVVVDGAPVAPELKIPTLKKVFTKLFAKHKIELADGPEDLFYMPLDNKKTTGFFFVKFASQKHAELAIKALNGKKLDAKHRLFLNKLLDVEKYSNVEDTFVEPVVPPFKETENLKLWLLDPAVRDQFLTYAEQTLEVDWHKQKKIEPALQRTKFDCGFATWSPRGLYMVTLHPQGAKLWGGANFEPITKYPHMGVRFLDFSPDEKYMVTLSPDGITLPPEDHPAYATYPFTQEDVGHKLVIWDMQTGLPARTFGLPPNIDQKGPEWPLIKWSHDGQYFARKGPDALAVYELALMSLIDGKLVKIEGLQEFEFAPAPVKYGKEEKTLLAYWTPETANQTARVAVMEVPLRQVLRTVNLFQVLDCRFHWQNEARFLCVKVDRHTKLKKTVFTNLEFFSLQEKDIPVLRIELKEQVINFAWEPKSDRFVTILRLDVGPVNLAIPRNNVNFYAPEIEKDKKNSIGIKKYKNFKTVSEKFCTDLDWSPRGRFIAVSTIDTQKNTNLRVDFYDLDYDGPMVLASDEQQKQDNVKASLKQIGDLEFFGLTNVSWDQSGRYFATWSSLYVHNKENGYKIHDFSGHILILENVDDFKQFAWRPRPPLLLTGNDRKKVRKQLREYSAQFDEQDAMEESTATRELILLRRKMLEEWKEYRASADYKLKQAGVNSKESENVEFIVIEEIKEEVIEEKTEIVE